MAEEIKNETNVVVEKNETPNVPEKKEIDKPSQDVDVQTQLQNMMVEMAKLKRANDKLSSENADVKRKYKATLSEQEQASMEKAEREAAREEQFNQLLRENQINKLEKNFILLGYTDEQANKAATAQYDGDTDALFKIQSEVQQGLIKAKEAEWLKSRPSVNAGVGGENSEITQEQFNKMGYRARVEFQQKYPETYARFTQ